MGENLVLGLFLVLFCGSSGLLLLFARHTGRRATPAGWRWLLLGNLLALLVLVSLFLVAGETYFRFLYDATDALDFTKVSERWFQRHYRQNTFGFRDNLNYALQIEPGK